MRHKCVIPDFDPGISGSCWGVWCPHFFEKGAPREKFAKFGKFDKNWKIPENFPDDPGHIPGSRNSEKFDKFDPIIFPEK